MKHRILNFNLVERSLEACAVLRLVGLWLLLISELSFSLGATTSYISMTLAIRKCIWNPSHHFLCLNSRKEIYLKTDLRVFSGETSLKRGNLRSKCTPSFISPQVSSLGESREATREPRSKGDLSARGGERASRCLLRSPWLEGLLVGYSFITLLLLIRLK